MRSEWRHQPPTQKQLVLLDRLRRGWDYTLPVPKNRGEAHDLISSALSAVDADSDSEAPGMNEIGDWGYH
jgi:hypothetical protein